MSELLVQNLGSSFLIVTDEEGGPDDTLVVEVFGSSSLTVLDAGIQGPPGPAGSGGTTRFNVPAPAGTWLITHGLGRVPISQIFLNSGELVLTDTVADSTYLTITFSQPTAGFVLAA